MKLTPAAATRTRTSPAPGSGVGTSSRRRTSGPPCRWKRIAFIGAATLPGIGALFRRAIRPPQIPSRTFDIRDFGARDGEDSSAAFRDAIAACAAAGGGRILVTDGRYRSGPIHLGSHMELHVAEGATLAFIPEPARYLPPVLTHWEGLEFMGYSPLVYAFEQSHVAITGKGTLDGGADAAHW